MKIEERHVLAEHTTLGIGGEARRYVEVASRDELVEAIKAAQSDELPIFVLGGGSNTLISDEGFRGAVIHLTMGAMTWTKDGEDTYLNVEAGATFDDAVREACARNLGGIESLSGIPGTAGGATVQNIGAYGQELSDVFVEAEVFNMETLEFSTCSKRDMKFAYRSTALKTPDNKLIVVSLTLKLSDFDADKAVAIAMDHGFKKLALVPPKRALDMRSRVLETRKSKAMCYDRDDVDSHSVGSFFTNPVVSNNEAARLKAQYTIQMTNMTNEKKVMPMYPADGGVKLSAAWLIEQAGFSRGYRLNEAALSSKHCLAIMNPGNATCADVIALASRIAQTVFIKYRVTLAPEIIYLTPSGIVPLQFELDPSKLAGNVRTSSMATF